ncbi:MAG: hypothetical protein KAG92_01120, partial [Deltaproteobacteria bacterium]|nr:hypothetical protein [Deltaproteobacteria bacterium]
TENWTEIYLSIEGFNIPARSIPDMIEIVQMTKGELTLADIDVTDTTLHSDSSGIQRREVDRHAFSDILFSGKREKRTPHSST